MKKGDLVILVIIFLSIFSITVFGFEIGPRDSYSDSDDPSAIPGIVNSGPTRSIEPEDAGFWVPCFINSENNPDSCTFKSIEQTIITDESESNILIMDPDYRFDATDPERDEEFDLKKLYLYDYDIETVPITVDEDETASESIPSEEITKVTFMIDPLPFDVFGSQGEDDFHLYTSSHFPPYVIQFTSLSTPSLDAVIDVMGRDGCKECYIDEGLSFNEECAEFRDPEESDYSCYEVDFQKSHDCSVVADLGPQLCEGVRDVGYNIREERDSADTDESADTDDTTESSDFYDPNIDKLSVPGYGGCREVIPYIEDQDQFNNPGRDWFWAYGSSSTIDQDYEVDERHTDEEDKYQADYSSKFKASDELKNTIGRCCGNDPEDYGALVRKDVRDSENRHSFYACVPDVHGFLWAASDGAGQAFKIYTVEREDENFDLTSNTENFYVCGGDEETMDQLDNIYETYDNGGVLLPEYMLVPNTIGTPATNVEISGRGEDDGSGDYSHTDCITPSNCPGASADSIVDESQFLDRIDDLANAIGPAFADECDFDGDGFQGRMIVDGIIYPYEGCDPPENGIYDCDDSDTFTNPNAIEYCEEGNINTVDNDCDGDVEAAAGTESGSVSCTPRGPNNPNDHGTYDLTYYDLKDRVMCHDVDSYGSFTECCGYSLDDTNCRNFDKGRREGSAIHTIEEFGGVNTNTVLMYGVGTVDSDYDPEPDDLFRLSVLDSKFDESINEWTSDHYSAFEFEIYFVANFELEVWIGLLNPYYIDGDETQLNTWENYVFPTKLRVSDYIVGEPVLGRWLHVTIPIEDIFPIADFDVRAVAFVTKVQDAKDAGTTVDAMITQAAFDTQSPQSYSNVIGLDKLTLRPAKLLDVDDQDWFSNTDTSNYYCTGTYPPTWISDLDDTEEVSGIPRGREACNSIPSFGWTGTKCCGDDNGKDLDQVGPYAFVEYFGDTQGACWAGRVIQNNDRMMLLEFDVQYLDSDESLVDETMKVSCSTDNCVYALPPRPGVIVENKHPETYDLYFVASKDYVNTVGTAIEEEEPLEYIGTGSVSPENSMLKAFNVPLQITYISDNNPDTNDFYTCNKDDYLDSIPDTSLGDTHQLLTNAHEHQSCDIVGKYFCDTPDGFNRGWSNKELIKTTSVAITPEGIYEDLVDEETGEILERPEVIHDEEETLVDARFRNNLKPAVNLIKNGGFENV